MLKWKNKAVYTLDQAKSIIRRVNKHMPRFAPISAAEISSLKAEVVGYNKINKPPVSIHHLISVRRLLATQMAMYSRYNINKYQAHMEDFFHKQIELKRPIVDILEEAVTIFNIPPLDVAKYFLLSQGFNFSTITSMIKTPKSFDKKIQSIVNWAIKNDSESAPHTQQVLQQSQDFENKLVKHLKDRGFVFQTQEELVEEQTAKHGRAVITPDILFAKPITLQVTHPNKKVETHQIRWIDAKNYLLVPAVDASHLYTLDKEHRRDTFIEKSIRDQADRYVREFGPGAFVFHYGFMEGINIPNVIFLDGSNI